MAPLILILGCTFIASLVASILTDNFFAGTIAALVIGIQAAALHYYKFAAQGLPWLIPLLIPFILIIAVLGAGLGTASSDSLSHTPNKHDDAR